MNDQNPIQTVEGIPRVPPKYYHIVVGKLREYFHSIGFTNAYLQNKLDILAACEDPTTVAVFNYNGSVYPLPQTNQMRLEEVLLKNPDLYKGLYVETTSYREEPEPVEGRHDKTFPMFEFESFGNMEDLIRVEENALKYLGFTPAGGSEHFPRYTYSDMQEHYGLAADEELTHDHEKRMEEDFGPVVFITDFPEMTDPFFNMKRDLDNPGFAKKVDVIVGGMETMGSAERECSVEAMRRGFYSISDGKYAQTLFGRFRRDRTLKELEDYLSLTFLPRFGCGVGVTRLIKAMIRYGLM